MVSQAERLQEYFIEKTRQEAEQTAHRTDQQDSPLCLESPRDRKGMLCLLPGNILGTHKART